MGKFGQKRQNCYSKLKFCTYTNSNMQNSMVMFVSYLFIYIYDRKYPFLANLVRKVKITSWSQNLVPTLIQICRIQCCCSFFFVVFEWKHPFWWNFVQNVKIISWSWNLVARLIPICRIQWCCSFFSFLSRNTLFGQIWSKTSKFSL